MQWRLSTLDPRVFQVVFQAVFLSYGLLYLEWKAEWLNYSIYIGGCVIFNYLLESRKQKKLLNIGSFNRWGFSVLISALSLCLLLKTNHWYTTLLATLLTVSSKYIFRRKHKHIFNPSAFGIVATIALTNDAWLSPGQWGSNAIIFFTAITLGTIVVTKVQKLDVTLAFLFTYIGLLFWRQVYYLGWPADYFIHSISTGSLLLFSFFMISDPRTAPDHKWARIIWAMLIAVISFYLSTFKWLYNTPIWILVLAAPLVPLMDRLFKADYFQWKQFPLTHSNQLTIKREL
ncbi:MAG: RnfABCDGE type electron transport complex subunit D [Flavisolibacter sp.]